MTQVWVKTNEGAVMRLGDAQKARKSNEALTYEIVGEGDGAGWQAGSAADARLDAGGREIEGDAVGANVEHGREPVAGQHPDEDVGGMGQEARRSRGRPRRDEGNRA